MDRPVAPWVWETVPVKLTAKTAARAGTEWGGIGIVYADQQSTEAAATDVARTGGVGVEALTT